jgi:general secretion pathway protein I
VASKTSGFTLLEVLVALAIFAISALVVLEQSTLSINQQRHLENKTLALWLAENQFASLRLQGAWPNTGTTESVATFGQHNWAVEQTTNTTANPLLRKVTVTVSMENQASPLITLDGYMGEH